MECGHTWKGPGRGCSRGRKKKSYKELIINLYIYTPYVLGLICSFHYSSVKDIKVTAGIYCFACWLFSVATLHQLCFSTPFDTIRVSVLARTIGSSLSVCLSVCLCPCLSLSLSVCMCLSLYLCLSVSISLCLFLRLSVSLSLFLCLSVCFSLSVLHPPPSCACTAEAICSFLKHYLDWAGPLKRPEQSMMT